MTKLHRWSFAAAFMAAFFMAAPVSAQWQVPDHSVPIGRGSGTGFKNAAPGVAGTALTSTGASSDPAFKNIAPVSLDVSLAGTDVTTVLQGLINGLPATGGVVRIPAASSCYQISSTITLGNGTNSSNSTRNNISIVGEGEGTSAGQSNQGAKGASCIQWVGAAHGTMIQAAGPITNPVIENVGLYAGASNQADTCVQIIHAFASRVDNVSCSDYAGNAYAYNTRTAKTGVTFGNAFGQQINSKALAPSSSGAIAIDLDGDTASDSSTYNVKFIGGLYTYGGGTNSCGARFAFADNNTMMQIIFNPQNAGTGLDICFASPGGLKASWPHANVFYNVVGSRGWGGTCGTGRNWWMPFPSYEGTPASAVDCVNYVDYDNNWVAANSDITFKNKSGGGTSGRFDSSGGMIWGAPTGDDKGAGTINAQELYDSGNRVVNETALLVTNGIAYGTSTNGIASTLAMTNGQILVGQTTLAPVPQTVSGDATLANTGALTLSSVISAAGPIGSATSIPVITYDAKGRLTAVTTATPSVTSVNGVSYPSSYTSGGIPYASSSSAIASSGVLSANQVVIGGGAGSAPTSSSALPNGITATTQTALDNSTKVATTAYVDSAAPQGAWTTYAPSATCNGAAVNGTNGSVVTYAKYWKQGKTVAVTIDFTCQSTAGTGAILVNLPFATGGSAVLNGREYFTSGKMVAGATNTAASTSLTLVGADNTSTFAQSSKFVINGTYEAQ